MDLEAVGTSTIGVGRTRIEEAFTVVPERHLYAVASSSAPYHEGEHAARYALSAIRLHVEASANSPPTLDGTSHRLADALAFARRGLRDANHSVGSSFSSTGIVAALVVGRSLQLARIGACRVHHVRDGAIIPLVDSAAQTPASSPVRPPPESAEQNLDVPSSTECIALQSGDLFVLSTKGIHGTLTDKEVLSALATGRTLRDCLDGLVASALNAAHVSRPTDVTCVLVRVP